ncbi:MAG: YraN family protein [Pirellulaceae bacterium]
MLRRLTQWIDQWRFGTIDPKAPLGRRGEQAAERFLRKKGYRIVAQNDRQGIGEIDIVAVENRTVVFVEVKTRSSERRGHPGDHVDRDKEQRLTRAALSFLKRHRLLEHRARIDVIAVWWPPELDEPERIEHYENAVQPTGRYQWFNYVGGESAMPASRLGIFGGSFDPVHTGHLILADLCREALCLDKVLWVPAAKSPLKPRGPEASNAARLEMLQLAIDGHPAFHVHTCELQHPAVSPPPSALRDEYPRAESFC